MLESSRLVAAQDAAYRYFSATAEHRLDGVAPKEFIERAEEAFIELCLAQHPTISIEVGAHGAGFSRAIRRGAPDAQVLAVEANPHVHGKFEGGLRRRNIDYRHLAVSTTSGTVELGIPRRIRGKERPRDSRIASLGRHRDAADVEMVAVQSQRLDELVQPTDDDRLVAWIDVEGANQTVLESGPAVLAHASLVFIEVESEQVWEGQWLDVDVHRFFADLGLVPIFRDIQIPARRHQHNVAYASPDVATDPATVARVEELYRR